MRQENIEIMGLIDVAFRFHHSTIPYIRGTDIVIATMMKNLIGSILGKLFAQNVPETPIPVDGVGSLIFDADEEAWGGSIRFEFGDVRLLLDGNWKEPGNDGRVRPHEETLTWSREIAADPDSFLRKVTAFLQMQPPLAAEFRQFLEIENRSGFDEVHLYACNGNSFDGVVSYVSKDGMKIWRIAFRDKEPKELYPEHPI